MNAEFTEQQKFNQWWLWVLLLPIAALPLIGLYVQVVRGEPWGDKPMSDLGLVVMACLVLSLLALFWAFTLHTRIDDKGIYIRFVPFTSKQFNWNELASVDVLQYGFVGGWGIRLGTKYGTVYNVRGNKGLAIRLKNGKKYLVGTQRAEEMRGVIERHWPSV